MLKVQKSYLNLIEAIFTKSEINEIRHLDPSLIGDYAIKYFQRHTLKVKFRGKALSSAEYRVINLLLEVKQFWIDNSDDFIQQIREETPYALTFTLTTLRYQILDITKRLGVYFDTISIVDPLHIPESDKINHFISDQQYSSANLLELLEEAIVVLKLFQMNSDDTEKQIFMVIPEKLERTQEVEFQTLKLSLEFTNQIFIPEKRFSGLEELQFVLENKPNTIGDRLNDPEFFERLNKYWTSLGFHSARKISIDTEDSSKQYSSSKWEDVQLTPSEYYKQYLRNCKSMIQGSYSSFISAKDSFSDPMVHQSESEIFKWLQAQTDLLSKEPELELEESIITKSLLNENFNFLESISPEGLKIIRQEGLFEDLRKRLRLSRWSLRESSIENYESGMAEFQSQFLEIMNEFEYEHNLIDSKYKKSVLRSIPKGAAAVGLGLASVLIPELLILSIGSLVAGTFIGGKSVRDYVGDHKEKKKKKEALNNTPVAVLFEAMSNHQRREG